jgi:hemolysin activation/secretion protein
MGVGFGLRPMRHHHQRCSGFVISGEVSAAETISFGRDFTLMPFAFAEIGWAASNTFSESFAHSEEGASIGIGFDFSLLSKQSGRLYAALPLIEGPV